MGATGWSAERRQRQREAIQRWKPWEQSTGPRTREGKSCRAFSWVRPGASIPRENLHSAYMARERTPETQTPRLKIA